MFPKHETSTPPDMTNREPFSAHFSDGCHGTWARFWRRTRPAPFSSPVHAQQTQVGTVLPYYKDWLRRFPNFAAVARASEAEVLRLVGLVTTTALEIFNATAKSSQLEIVKHFRGRSIGNNFPSPGNTPPRHATFAFDQPVAIIENRCAITSARFANSDRFDCWTERALELCLRSHSKKGQGRI